MAIALSRSATAISEQWQNILLRYSEPFLLSFMFCASTLA
jgi:hypothetical protein